MDTFSEYFLAVAPKMRADILAAFRQQQSKGGFRSVWEHFEEIINRVLVEHLTKPPFLISPSDIIATKKKSTYPDLKVTFQGRVFALDVKSGEDSRDPWYDIGRLDTYEHKHLNKYAAEFCVIVRWKGRQKTEVVDVYIEATYQTVGYRAKSNGVSYRPYDGKLRPKPWSLFENQKSLWRDLDHFKIGLEASLKSRWRSHILDWYQKMSVSERKALQLELARIDAGKPVSFDREVEGDEESELPG